MRVLFVPGSGVGPASGGQGSFCANLIPALGDLGAKVTLWADRAWDELAREWGLRRVERVSGLSEKVDLVHGNGPGIGHVLAALRLRRPCVLTHEDYRYLCPAGTAFAPEGCAARAGEGPCQGCRRRGVRERARLAVLQRLVAHPSVWNVAISEAFGRRLELPRSSVVLHPVLALAHRFAVVEPVPGLIAFAGRLVPEKGLDVVLRSLAEIPAARLQVAGEGPAKLAWVRMSEELGVADRVEFRGAVPVDEVYRIYASSEIVCVPSVWAEPFGYSAAEAMALGKAVVASDRGSFPELLAGGRGWVASPEKTAEWVGAIRAILNDRELREQRGARALAFVESFMAPAVIASQYMTIYEQALAAAAE